MGPIEPLAKWPSAAYPRTRATVDRADVRGLGGAVAQHRVRHVGGDDEHVGVDGPRQQRRAEVLVDDRLDARAAEPSASRTTGIPPPPLATTTKPASTRACTAGRVEDLQRLGRGDHAPPALLAAVLPGLAVLDAGRRLLGRQEAADRLGRLR